MYVPVLYFMQAMPVAIVQELASVFFKDMGIANAPIVVWTSLISLPWSMQFLLGPLVELSSTRRRWVFQAQFIISICLGLLAFIIHLPNAFIFCLLVLGTMAITSALCNIATDGLYILAMDGPTQAKFIGVQTTCYRLGRLFCVGLLVLLVGVATRVEKIPVNAPRGGYIELKNKDKSEFVTSARIGIQNSSGGALTDDEGREVLPKLEVPAGTMKLTIRGTGEVLADGKTVGRIAYLTTNNGQTPKGDIIEGGVQLGSTDERTAEAKIPIMMGWTFGIALAAILYFVGFSIASRTTPYPSRDVRPEGDEAAETPRNIARTVLIVSAGVSGYFFLNALVRLVANTLGDQFNQKGWLLPKENLILGMPVHGNPAMVEMIQMIGCLAVLVTSVILMRQLLKGSKMAEALVSFTRIEKFYAVFGFILFYRFGEAMVSRLTPLFVKDPIGKGGLALSNAQFGLISIAGIVGIVVGGIAGGWFLSQRGLKRGFWPMVICMHSPNLLYVYAAYAQPSSIAVLNFIQFVDQFGYGFGYAGYSVYLMSIANRGNFKTAHYAIGTGLGALCITSAAIIGGIIQSNYGWQAFYVSAVLLTIPGTLILLIIPHDEDKPDEAAGGPPSIEPDARPELDDGPG